MHSERPRPRCLRQNDVRGLRDLLLLVVLSCSIGAHALPESENDGFLAWFWKRPLDSQGKAFKISGAKGHPLSPSTCGQCHAAQLNEWAGSRHARAMGIGVLAQLAGKTPEQVQACLDCHAPLREQADSLRRNLACETDQVAALAPNSTEEPLHTSGVVCAVCHVRNYEWFGPPRREGAVDPFTSEMLPHDGWNVEEAFEDSRFCAACHQFPAGGYELNGKLIENTYEEWRASPQAARGETCQSCHMPDRRHLFLGIHDLDMVRSGVSISAYGFSLTDQLLRLSLSLSNSGTGHFFPTYVTPSVVLDIYQVSLAGQRIDGTDRQLVIARDVSLDLAAEYSDTRIAPGDTVTLDYAHRQSPAAAWLVADVRVEPDAFYRRFFEAMLETELAADTRVYFERALSESCESTFTLFTKQFDLAEADRLLKEER